MLPPISAHIMLSSFLNAHQPSWAPPPSLDEETPPVLGEELPPSLDEETPPVLGEELPPSSLSSEQENVNAIVAKATAKRKCFVFIETSVFVVLLYPCGI